MTEDLVVYVGNKVLDGLGVSINELYNTLNNPETIAVISSICFISTTVADFRLPYRNYKFLTSSWFHASLMQVVNESCSIFNLMCSLPIQLESQIAHILKALNHLIGMQGTHEEKSAIEHITSFKKMVMNVIDKFNDLIQLIKELNDATTTLESKNLEAVNTLKKSLVILSNGKHNLMKSFSTLITTEETKLHLLLSNFVDSVDFLLPFNKTVHVEDVSKFYLNVLVQLDEILSITDTQELKIKEAEIQTLCSKSQQDSKSIANTVEISFKFSFSVDLNLAQFIKAPESIISLGQLCLVSATTSDIELLPNDNDRIFKYLSTTWFHAGLHQVIKNASTSFSFADKNLKQIRVSANNISECALETARLGKTEKLSSLLDDIEKEKDKYQDLVQAVERRFIDLVQLIYELNKLIVDYSVLMNQMNGAQIVIADNLLKGLQALSKVKMHWLALVVFFAMLRHILEWKMNNLCEFIQSIDQMDKSESASKIATIAAQVSLVSGLYLNISQNHLVDLLVQLDSLLTFKHPAELERAVREMSDKCYSPKY